jgi:hypothetical protein
MRRYSHVGIHITFLLVTASALARAAEMPAAVLDEVVITALRSEWIGPASSASQGTVSHGQLENRPELRPAEVLEVVPGLVVTQHSGDGKANQYFLRGFNLDHGTDFATRVDGIPVNMPTHAHGQGYSDLNFLIPELIDRVEYRKGTYYAEEGDFSAAGAADIRYRRTLDQPWLVSLQGGQEGYQRALLASCSRRANGDLVIAAEYSRNDGPWIVKEGYRKRSGVLKYTRGDDATGFDLTAMGYDGHWRSTDQIPLRAVESGLISRFGAIDPTDGGQTHRYSLSGGWWRPLGKGRFRASVYAVDYHLDLLSDFTYDTDPVHGDQFEQYDQRRIYGGDLTYSQPLVLLGHDGTFKSGLQIRYDEISPVGLYRTEAGVRYGTVRQDQVTQGSYSAYFSQAMRWNSWLRSEVGARIDAFGFDVHSSLAANSGARGAAIASPKVTLVLDPWSRTEYFLNFGTGFHSNDARGTTITVDPNDGVTPVRKVDPLVRAVGAELGLRTALIPKVQLVASAWTLKLESELLFTGDGGTTEPSRATRRSGFELGVCYTPTAAVVIDSDFAWSHARFSQFDPAGDRIPNALGTVISLGLTYHQASGYFGGANLRYVGPAPLTEDNSVRSAATLLVNAEGGYHINRAASVRVTVFNLLNRRENDIAYYYESQLPGEAAPVADLHFHPAEPRTVRLAWTLKF